MKALEAIRGFDRVSFEERHPVIGKLFVGSRTIRRDLDNRPGDTYDMDMVVRLTWVRSFNRKSRKESEITKPRREPAW